MCASPRSCATKPFPRPRFSCFWLLAALSNRCEASLCAVHACVIDPRCSHCAPRSPPCAARLRVVLLACCRGSPRARCPLRPPRCCPRACLHLCALRLALPMCPPFALAAAAVALTHICRRLPRELCYTMRCCCGGPLLPWVFCCQLIEDISQIRGVCALPPLSQCVPLAHSETVRAQSTDDELTREWISESATSAHFTGQWVGRARSVASS